MNNISKSATPEQKFYILANELKVPIDIIRGFAALIKKELESEKVDPEKVMKMINKIAETADKIKELRDELVRT